MSRKYKKEMKKMAPINNGQVFPIINFRPATKVEVLEKVDVKWRKNSKYFCFEHAKTEDLIDPNTTVGLRIVAIGFTWYVIDDVVYQMLPLNKNSTWVDHPHTWPTYDRRKPKKKKLIFVQKAGKRILKELQKKVNLTNLESGDG